MTAITDILRPDLNRDLNRNLNQGQPASASGAAPGAAFGPNIDFHRPALIGGLSFLLLAGVLGTWAATAQISSAVIAGGQAMVHGRPKLVQSLDGGVVQSIAVQNGDIVQAGQLLLQLDPTLLTINLDIARGRLAAALALRARLMAEQLGQADLVFTYPALPFALPDTRADEAGQRQIFAARAAVLRGGRDQLTEAQLQLDNQISGVAGQIAAIRDQMGYLQRDIDNQTTLVEQGLARQSQLGDVQRNMSQLGGQLASLEAEQARLTNAQRDRELDTLQAERSFMEQVVTDLRGAVTQTEELTLEIVTRSAQLDRIAIRAPADGIINELQVTTIGGVITPGATILEVVPLGEGMDFELRVDPRAIDDVYPGQPAQILMSAFDTQSTPKLTAHVTTISAGAITDPQTGQSFYRVGLEVTPAELARLGDVTLMPGMPVEAFLETGDRSVLTYLLDPITSQLQRAFRE